MNQGNYKSHRECYLQAMFGKGFSEKKKTDQERVKAALKLAHEIRQFEIRLYWQRSFFFWGFLIILFTGLFFLIGTKQEFSILAKTEQEFSILDKTEQKSFIRENELLFSVFLFVLCCLGLLVSFAWLYIHKGSRTWQKNWEYHIDFLEDKITGKLHKSAIGERSEFFSPSQIHKTIIQAFIIVWLSLVICTAYGLYYQFISYLKIENPYSVCVFYILLLFVGLVIYLYLMAERKDSALSWRTSKETISGESDRPSELHLFLRGLPKAIFIESPGNKNP